MWSLSCCLPLEHRARSGRTYPGATGSYRQSPRERPGTEVAPGPFEQCREPARLEEQEHDDEQAEDDLVQCEPRQEPSPAGFVLHERDVGRLTDLLDHLWQPHDDDRA